MVCPGFVDPHTHYDAQLFWDPLATPSNVHGVTSVVGGNCGFTLAPLQAEDADYLRRMMAKVEGMPLAALEKGVDWTGRPSASTSTGSTAASGSTPGSWSATARLRRYVMGADAVGNEATPEQLDAMVACCTRRSRPAGSASRPRCRRPTATATASRWRRATPAATSCSPCARRWASTRAPRSRASFEGCLDKFSDDEIELVAAMSAAAGRPINWNVLTVDSAAPTGCPASWRRPTGPPSRAGRSWPSPCRCSCP